MQRDVLLRSRERRSALAGRGPALAAFTLIEIVIALAVLGTMSTGAYLGFNTINAYSVSSRLYSEAQAICQNQIDLILSNGPFDLRTNRVPPVLKLGVKDTENVFIYRDPVTGNVIVTGKMTTTITDAGLQMTYAGSTADLNLRRATVTVSYRFRNTNYDVTMETLRTTDL
jgi:prepilin-type N-terminal cleavage/methylation domain-containing protein